MKKILTKIYNNQFLKKRRMFFLFDHIMNKKINNIQLSAILAIMAARKETIEEVIGARNACLQYIPKFPKLNYIYADIVGTGGDQKNSFNISTVSSIVAACYGIKIIKVCNVSSSSAVGSVDLLNHLNINVFISPERSKKLLDVFNICFLSANQYLYIFKKVEKVRKILNTKTIFNILGPLLNPSNPSYGIIGVHSPELLLYFAKILKKLKYNNAIVVHSEGADEIILCDKIQIAEVKNNTIKQYNLTPKDFWFKKQKRIIYSTKQKKENYRETINLFKGLGKKYYVDTIAANVALLLKITNYSHDLISNTSKIIQFINSGKIYNFIHQLSHFTIKNN
ncbi:anthranilate synthase component II [Buchnera aphidicola (Cinara tujafilina)]|uniref:Anthranilate synthase component II n=1 Tax=Buchnera aphidicola (Cinara tujafilina) TaxID=261317 RepID=F7WZA9_9GAMM|nr:anthranilate phosphoribosyltransferase [Buchnera aphidicola]AEH39768.1 anthranilate synthase component II [Buchnera aphidicola (Cinara tujafilina)]